MDLSKDFVLPPLEADKPIMAEEQASDTAFYTAASSSPTPIDDYHSIYADLSQNGGSQVLDNALAQFKQEQSETTKQIVKSIIEDPSIPVQEKTGILSTYSVGGYISQDIRDRYIQRSASLDLGDKPSDTKAQDEVLKNLPNALTEVDNRTQRQNIVEGEAHFSNYAKAFGITGVNLLSGLGAGVVGTLYSIYKRDAVAGKELFDKYAEDWAIMPKEAATQRLVNGIGETLSVLGVPAQRIKEQTMRMTGSAGAGIVTGVILDPLNFVDVGVAASVIKKSIKGEGPKVRPGSPLDTTTATNPKMAHDLALGALEDADGTTARALGTDKAAIVNEFVLPKALPLSERGNNPDLSAALSYLDADLEETFKANRFDPNIQDATQRRADIDAVYSILNETREPKYLQSQSYISSTDNVFEGKAVFSKDRSYFYSTKEDVIHAYNQIEESIMKLPKEEQGTLFIVDKLTGTKYKPAALMDELRDEGSINQFSVEWEWKKEYDDLNLRIFGPDAVKTSILGIDASRLARSGAARWFFSHSTLPKWYESSALRQAERSAYVSGKLLNVIRNNIANTPHKKELDALIRNAEELGKEYYNKQEIQRMFPDLGTKQVDDLFETHTYWRRVNHYNHAVANDIHANTLKREGFTKGLFVEDRYYGPINEDIKFTSTGEVPLKVWDMDLDIPIKFQWLDTKKDATYDVGGKRLGALKKPVVGEDGVIYEYALFGGRKSKTDILPQQVLPRIPGYSPIKTEGHFFVRMTPTKLNINGWDVIDKTRLSTHSRVIGVAKNEFEAKKLQEMFEQKYPDHVIDYRPERGADYGRIVDDMQAHGELLRNAMQRGERLTSIDGPAPVEDRLVTLVNTTRSLQRQNAMRVWEEATKEAFVKDFGEFLPLGTFPESLSDIKPRPNMNREEAKSFANARRVFEYYSKIKSFETLGDHIWKTSLHAVADILEKWKIPSNLVRDVANKGNLLFNAPRQAASLMFIHLNPLKQWLVQPAQLLEMYAIFPQRAIQNMVDLGAVRLALASEAPVLKGKGKWVNDLARKMAPSMSKRDFDDTVKAIKESGIMQSVDLNMLVHGVFNDVERGLREGSWEKAYNDIVTVPRAAAQLSRSIGFDFAELNNRIGLWLQVRDLWKSQNPGKNWNTLENREIIATEAFKLSGAMNRAGSLPYQQGALSTVFQFAAISQKLLFNLIQDNATILTSAQRARLTAARSALWGVKYGIPGGALVYYFLDKSEDPVVQENAEVLKRGLFDRVGNYILQALAGSEESDVSFGKSMSPYGELTSGMPYIDVAFEMAKMFDERPAGPRFPALGAVTSLGQAVDRFQSWFITKDITGESWSKAVWEAAKVASSMSNWAKGQLMLSTKDKITKNGNHLGLNATAAEAYGQMLGFSTYREEDLWSAASQIQDRKEMIKSMAGEIHQWMSNQKTELGDDSWETHFGMLTSFMSMLKNNDNWTDQDIKEVADQVVELDRQQFKDVNTSVLMSLLKARTDENDEQLKIVEKKLRLSADPKTKELLDILDGKRKP